MNAWLVSSIRKWLGIYGLFTLHVQLRELEDKVAVLSVKPKRDVRGRFEK
jgi:hypothetical protein